MHEIVNAPVRQRRVIRHGDHPEVERSSAENGGRARMHDEFQECTQGTASGNRREYDTSCAARQPRSQLPLRSRRQEEDGGDHHEDQMLHLMHEEEMIGEEIQWGLQRGIETEETGEEAPGPPTPPGAPPGRARPSAQAPQVHAGDQQDHEADLRSELPLGEDRMMRSHVAASARFDRGAALDSGILSRLKCSMSVVEGGAPEGRERCGPSHCRLSLAN